MRDFAEIHRHAAARKGGAEALEAMLSKPRPVAELEALGDDRWLSAMAKALFQAGFNWRVIDAKWDGFEEALEGFDPARIAFYHDEDLDRLLADTRVVHNGAKLSAVIDNARLLNDLAREHGTAARTFAHWPASEHVALLDLLAKRGKRLGGVTGQRVLRAMGKDSYVLSPDVTARLIAEGVVAKAVTSKRDMASAHAAFETWQAQSGRSFTEISQIAAMSVGD